ncbi:MAG: FAD-dependent monooxygenase, partial [Hyphomonadaceae bacterium]|nr:FAD-dependent monooxygenase [Clostridia bacterium]
MTKLIINNIRLSLDDDVVALKSATAIKLNVDVHALQDFKIIKQSVDARRKHKITMIYNVSATLDGNHTIPVDQDIRLIADEKPEALLPGNLPLKTRPVVVGSGPAGMFAGLILAQHGYRPIIIERGANVENRSRIVAAYWKNGGLDSETNVQFGEGGAGTFSDGKLTTRIHDRRCETVLNAFHACGAHADILYKAKPHIGSDVLKTVVVNMRKQIEQLGGEFHFNTKLTSLKISNGKIKGIILNNHDEIATDVVVLAIGHSARDTFEALLLNGVPFEQKPFSIGVRIEHPQAHINQAQYGIEASIPKLGAAEYQLFHKIGGRTAYSFCMCPGGIVVASASEQGTIVTNGMSEYARNRDNANSAFVVSVEP